MSISLQKKFETLTENLPISAYWKDKKGKYIKIYEGFLLESKIHSESDVIGQSDQELWGAKAPSFSANDKRVLFREKNHIFIEEHIVLENKKFYLSCKSPWYSEDGKIIGIFGSSLLLNSQISLSTSSCFEKWDPFLELLHAAYANHEIPILTKRQKECLKYLAKGMTLKQIGASLNLSPRTVEHYLHAIKTKLQCGNRYELIQKANELNIL